MKPELVAVIHGLLMASPLLFGLLYVIVKDHKDAAVNDGLLAELRAQKYKARCDHCGADSVVHKCKWCGSEA